MAPSSSTPQGRATFLEDCINKRQSEKNIYETLDLYGEQKGRGGKDPDFANNEVNELRAHIKDIAQSFATDHAGDFGSIRADLANENTFAKKIQGLLAQYGQGIWGEQVGHSRSFVARKKLPDEHDWDKPKDRDSIYFYVHCWIARLAVVDAFPTPRKKRAKRKPETIDLTQQEPSNDERSSSEDNIPYQAPEVPNMQSAFQKTTNNRQAPIFGLPKSNGQTRTIDLDTGIDQATGSTIKRPSPVSPNKRKSRDLHGQDIVGKLQKVFKEPGRPQFPYRPHQHLRDPYSIPASPAPATSAFTSINTHDRQRQRETTCDSDATWRPRGTTAETETLDDDANEIMADEIDLLIQPDSTNDVDMDSAGFDQHTADSSGTYRDPGTQDSVIPNTPNDARADAQILLHAFGARSTIVGNNNDRMHDDHAAQLSAMTLNYDGQKKKALQRELFNLLLSFLNGMNQFAEHSYEPDAEKRMNHLLEKLWRDDKQSFRNRLGEHFDRLDAAQRTWMNMRDRLRMLRQQTGYTGLPGEDWKAYLRGMNDARTRAQACIAFNDMKEQDDGEPLLFTDTFDEDLAHVFDLVTQVKGCNGADEFRAIQAYNGALFAWIKEEEG